MLDYSRILIMNAVQRSGTHAIGDVLSSHPEVTYCDEVFLSTGLDQIPYSYYHFVRTQNAENFLPTNNETLLDNYLMWLLDMAGTQKIILDIKYNQWTAFSKEKGMFLSPPALFELVKKKQIQILHLTRNNLLRVYVSGITGQSKTKYNEKRKINIDTSDLICWLDSQSHQRKIFDSYLKTCNAAQIDYSEVFKSFTKPIEPAILQSIADWINVENLFYSKPRTVKRTILPLKSIIDNYADVEKSLTDTPYVDFLRDEPAYQEFE